MTSSPRVATSPDLTADLIRLLKYDSRAYDIALSLPDFSGVTTDIFNFLKPRLGPDDVVIDYGSGAGHLSGRILSETPASVVSVEIFTYLRRHQQRVLPVLAQSPDRLTLLSGLARYDGDCSCIVLAALSLSEQETQDAVRILRKGGWFIVSSRSASMAEPDVQRYVEQYRPYGLALKTYRHDTEAMREYRRRVDTELFPALDAAAIPDPLRLKVPYRDMLHDNTVLIFEKVE